MSEQREYSGPERRANDTTEAITPSTPIKMPLQMVFFLMATIGAGFVAMVVGDVRANTNAIESQAKTDTSRIEAMQETMNATLVTLQGVLVEAQYTREILTSHIKTNEIHKRE